MWRDSLCRPIAARDRWSAVPGWPSSVVDTHVTIAVAGTSVPPQVGPGASRQSLVGYLGPPDYESTEAEGLLLLYRMCAASVEDCNVLNILLVDDRVRWISWGFYPDEPSWPA